MSAKLRKLLPLGAQVPTPPRGGPKPKTENRSEAEKETRHGTARHEQLMLWVIL